MTTPEFEEGKQFDQLTEPYRAELILHSYRLLGSLGDAEDVVQEAMLRAWQKLSGFRGDASLRAWLYKITTNACLDELRKRARRTLPHHQEPPSNPHEPFALPLPDAVWLEPLPDSYMEGVTSNPEARYSTRESVQFAFLVALHALPARQRAVLLLCDVLDWRVKEAAELLESSESAVNSALHRARKSLTQHSDVDSTSQGLYSARADVNQSVLDQYVAAWEQADIQGLTTLLQQAAALVMPPSTSWYQGNTSIAAFLQANLLGRGQQWQLRPWSANAQPAFALYLFNGEIGRFQPFGLQVLSIRDHLIDEIVLFVGAEILARFEPAVEG